MLKSLLQSLNCESFTTNKKHLTYLQNFDHKWIELHYTVWRESFVMGKFGELSAKLPLAK